MYLDPNKTRQLLEDAERDLQEWVAQKVAAKYANEPRPEGGLTAPRRPHGVPMRYVLKPETEAKLKAMGVELPHG